MTSLSKPTATSELVEYRDAEIKQMALIEQAWKALAQASTFKEFKDIRDQSSAVKQLMRKRGMTLEAPNEAAKIYLAASLRMGEYLKNGMEKATGASLIRLPVTLCYQ